MDITWASIGKVTLAVIGTYVFLPAFLVLRDSVLWLAIRHLILTGKAQLNVRKYVTLAHEWNTQHAVNAKMSIYKSGTEYQIDGKLVSAEDYQRHSMRSAEIRKDLRKLELDLDRRAKYLSWLIKHYHQEPFDPINQWKKEEEQHLLAKDDEG